MATKSNRHTRNGFTDIACKPSKFSKQKKANTPKSVYVQLFRQGLAEYYFNPSLNYAARCKTTGTLINRNRSGIDKSIIGLLIRFRAVYSGTSACDSKAYNQCDTYRIPVDNGQTVSFIRDAFKALDIPVFAYSPDDKGRENYYGTGTGKEKRVSGTIQRERYKENEKHFAVLGIVLKHSNQGRNKLFRLDDVSTLPIDSIVQRIAKENRVNPDNWKLAESIWFPVIIEYINPLNTLIRSVSQEWMKAAEQSKVADSFSKLYWQWKREQLGKIREGLIEFSLSNKLTAKELTTLGEFLMPKKAESTITTDETLIVHTSHDVGEYRYFPENDENRKEIVASEKMPIYDKFVQKTTWSLIPHIEPISIPLPYCHMQDEMFSFD